MSVALCAPCRMAHAHCLNSIIIDFQYENSKQYVKFAVWLEYNLKIHSKCVYVD